MKVFLILDTLKTIVFLFDIMILLCCKMPNFYYHLTVSQVDLRDNLSLEGVVCEEKCQEKCTPDCDFTCCVPAHFTGEEQFAKGLSTSEEMTPEWVSHNECPSLCPSSCSPACSTSCCITRNQEQHVQLRPINGQL